MTFRPLLPILLSLLFFGCGSDEDNPATPDPATANTANTATGEPASETPEPSTPTSLEPNSDRVFPNSTNEHLDAAVGQWTRHRTTKDGEQASEIVYKIVGQEEDAWWIEVEVTGGPATMAFRILLAYEDWSRADSAEIRQVIVRMPNGRAQRFRGAMLDAVSSQYARFADGLGVDFAALTERETVETPAGRFEGAFRREDNTRYGQFDGGGTVFNHSAVPIMAMVRMESNEGSVIELVDFGLTGAESTFDGPIEDMNINLPGGIPSGLLERLMGGGAGMGSPGMGSPSRTTMVDENKPDMNSN